MIRRTKHLLATLEVQAARFADLCYFVPQLCDALFDGLLHEDRLAETGQLPLRSERAIIPPNYGRSGVFDGHLRT